MLRSSRAGSWRWHERSDMAPRQTALPAVLIRQLRGTLHRYGLELAAFDLDAHPHSMCD